MATVASAALAIVAAGHLAADPDAVTVGAAAVAVAILARVLPLPTPASVVVSLLAAAGAGVAVGGATGLGAKGALLGAGAAVCALVGHRVASYDYPSRFVHFTAVWPCRWPPRRRRYMCWAGAGPVKPCHR